MITEPMLAGTVKDVTKLRFPLIATPKLDGIRALMINGQLVSRKFKPIPNHYIRETLERFLPDGMDGEIVVPNTPFNEVASAVMSRDGEPDFVYCVFDYVCPSYKRLNYSPVYEVRIDEYKEWLSTQSPFVRKVIHAVKDVLIKTVSELEHWEEFWLEQGYEGVMLRSPDSPYKCGRSTFKEHYLLKLKRFEDSEAVCIGMTELMHNENEAEEDAFGRTKRSSKKAGKVGSGMMGTLIVRDVKSGVEFEIGTGFTQEQRKEMWENRDQYDNGFELTYKFQPHGVKDKPRAPVFKAWRLD